jgi:hypothetical protein
VSWGYLVRAEGCGFWNGEGEGGDGVGRRGGKSMIFTSKGCLGDLDLSCVGHLRALRLQRFEFR